MGSPIRRCSIPVAASSVIRRATLLWPSICRSFHGPGGPEPAACTRAAPPLVHAARTANAHTTGTRHVDLRQLRGTGPSVRWQSDELSSAEEAPSHPEGMYCAGKHESRPPDVG